MTSTTTDEPNELLARFVSAWPPHTDLRPGRRFPGDVELPVGRRQPGQPVLDPADNPRFVELDFTVDEFVSVLVATGTGGESLWPRSTTLDAGCRLLAVHVVEAIETRLRQVEAVVVTMPHHEMEIHDARDRVVRYW